MADELIEAGIVKQDIEDIDEILKRAGKPLPILREEDTDVSFLPVTEAFLTGIIARKKRLQRRNLQVEINNPDVKTPDEKSTKSGDVIAILEEGTHKSGYLEKSWHQMISYQREQKEIASFYDMNTLCYYILKNADGNSKVSSVYTKRFGEYFGREKESANANMKEVVGNIVNFSTVLIFGSTSAFVVTTCVERILRTTFLKDILILLFILIVFGGFFGSIAMLGVNYLVKRPFYKKKRIRSRQVTAKLREKEPEFCLEKFLSILNSKLLRLLYADGTEEIGDIVSCDMAQFLQDHEDVVNCEFRNFWFTDMREDGDYMYLDVVYKVTLYRDLGTKIKREKQMIYMRLARPIHGIMESDLYNDWSIVKIETRKK